MDGYGFAGQALPTEGGAMAAAEWRTTTPAGVMARLTGQRPPDGVDHVAVRADIMDRLANGQRVDDEIRAALVAKHTPRGGTWIEMSSKDAQGRLWELTAAQRAMDARIVPQAEAAALQAARLAAGHRAMERMSGGSYDPIDSVG
jgi:hypothetical protein